MPKPAPKAPPNAKRARLYNSRTIRSEVVDPNSKDSRLDVSEFLASREYEIRAFEQSQLNTKYASSTRVFQSLPRTLRRRTASHNVKRIPKRMRARALREMQNTTNGVPRKKGHLRGRELHRLKIEKKLLRLAAKIKQHRLLPVGGGTIKERMAALNKQMDQIVKDKESRLLNNSVGAYDIHAEGKLADKPTGGMKYAHRQTEYTWTPTHLWHAKRFHMIKRWGYQIPFSPNQKCFRLTSRAAKDACIVTDTSYYGNIIAGCGTANGVKLLLRQYSKYSAEIPPWLTAGERAYNGWLYFGDKKTVGSLYVDKETCSVILRLHPATYEAFFLQMAAWAQTVNITLHDCRYAIGSILLRGPTALHALSKTLHLEATDEVMRRWRVFSQNKDPDLLPSGTTFAFSVSDPRFWKHPVRPPPAKGSLSELVLKRESAIDQNSVSALLSSNGRTESYRDMYSVKELGKEFARRSPLSPNIHGPNRVPLLIYKLQNGSWCVNLPWFWVQPFWSQLVRVIGTKPGGLRQEHQVNFESGKLTFPLDYPFTEEGYAENELARASLEAAREKLPASKQAPMTMEGNLLLGADWYFLRKWIFGLIWMGGDKKPSKEFAEFDKGSRVVDTEEDLAIVIALSRENDKRLPVCLLAKLDPMHKQFLANTFVPNIEEFPPLPVVQVQVKLVGKGLIRDNARIYVTASTGMSGLIGFVTSGGFNFNQGQPTGVGLVSAQKKDLERVFIRNVGSTSFWPAYMQKTS